ncbi:hypothetical protein HK104_004982, partial [Borealophlyctis nickersoniae]
MGAKSAKVSAAHPDDPHHNPHRKRPSSGGAATATTAVAGGGGGGGGGEGKSSGKSLHASASQTDLRGSGTKLAGGQSPKTSSSSHPPKVSASMGGKHRRTASAGAKTATGGPVAVGAPVIVGSEGPNVMASGGGHGAGPPVAPPTVSTVPFYNVSDVPMPPVEEVETMLELLMEDLNLTEDKKQVLRKLTNERKWVMLQQHLGERYRDGASRDVQMEIQEIQRLKDNPDRELLTNLVVSLRSRPIRWISNFIDKGGLNILLDNLQCLEEDNRHDDFEELYIKCLKSLMNNKIGLSAVLENEGSLNIIALSLRSPSPRTRALVLEIFGAVCLIPGGHRCVLEGMDALCDAAGMRFRFEIVVYALWQSCQGMTPLEKELQVASMSFINAVICGGPGVNLEFRMHLRYEFLQLGLMQLIDKIGFLENELLQTQIDVWIAGLEADEEETFQKVDIEFMNLDDSDDLYNALSESMKLTSCYAPFASIMRHILLLPANPFQRMKFMFIIDKVVQQIVLQRDTEDPDPAAMLADLDIRGMVAELMDTDKLREQEDKYRKQLEKAKRLEKELETAKTEGAQSKALKAKDEEISSLMKQLEEAKKAAGAPPPTPTGAGAPPPPPPPPPGVP